MKLPPLALRHIWLIGPLALVFIVGNTQGTAFQPDLWWQLAHGRYMVQSGHLIQTDPFTHTIGGRVITNPTWLAQLIFYGLHRAGGIKLVTLIVTFIYTLGFALITYLCWRRSNSCRIAAVCALVAVSTSLQNVATRAQAFSVLFFALELTVLWLFAVRWWAPLLIALSMLLWTNTHGAFALGVVLPLIFGLGRAISVLLAAGRQGLFKDALLGRYLLCAAAATIAAFCKPDPLSSFEYIGATASLAVQRNLHEWLPPDPKSFTSIVAFISLGLGLFILNLSKRRLDATESLLVFAFIFLSHSAARTVVWWGVVLAPILAAHMATIFKQEDFTRPAGRIGIVINHLIAAYLVAGALLSVPYNNKFNPFISAPDQFEHRINEPYALVEFLDGRGRIGNVFNPMGWGGYLSWHEADLLKVFVDERINLFPPEIWDDYVSVGQARAGWENLLDRYQVNTIVASGDITPRLVRSARQSTHWREVYSDSLGTVFERASP